MQPAILLQDLAVVMIVAGLVTVLFRTLRQPVVLGYIVAGVLVGPHALPKGLITDQQSIETLSQLGVVFLLFSLGLEFNFRKLRHVGAAAFTAAPFETALMFFLGFQIGHWFGWKPADCVYLGGILMISSTTIIAKTLHELGRSREKFAEVIFGILIAEDVIAILLIASLSGFALTGTLSIAAIAGTMARMGIFLVTVIVVGLLVLPRFLAVVGRFKNDETLLVTVLGLCFGLALVAVKMGYSVALGAFVMGAILAETEEIRRIEHLVIPLRDMFSAVFFVAIGLLIDLRELWQHAVPIAVISAALMVGKVVACSFGSFVAGYERSVALRVGLGLAQIGEFSFVIATLGQSVGATSSFLYPIAVGVSGVTSLLTPYLIRHADTVVELYDRLAPKTLLNYQRDYVSWVARLREARRSNVPRRLIRTMIGQLAINVALLAGLFIATLFARRLELPWLPRLPARWGGSEAVLWLGAMIVALPVFIATIRKLQAFGMLVSEVTTTAMPRPKRQLATRVLVANTILFTGIVGLSLLVLVFSSVLLPSSEVMLVLGILVALIAFLLKTVFIRIYSQAQVSIRETLAKEPPPAPVEPRRAMPPLLEEAELATLRITAASPACGQRIRDLALRTRTGATAVVLKRRGETIINPEPEITFVDGDDVLLLGNVAQLREAERLLVGPSERV